MPLLVPVVNKPGFLALIDSLTGLQPGATVWVNDPRPMIGDVNFAQVTLEMFSSTALGIDEHRRESSTDPVSGAPTMTSDDLGNRDIMITVKAYTYVYEAEATEILESIRAGLRLETSVAAMDVINLALVWAGTITRIPTVADNRALSSAALDIKIAGVSHIQTITTSGWITSIGPDPSSPNPTIPGTLTY